MENDTNYVEKAYTTSELATMLDIAVPTVRKYSKSLEEAGYIFIRGKGKGKYQSRLYVENDIMAFRYLKQLRENSNIKVSEATSIVINKFGKGAIQTVRHGDTAEIEPYNEPYSELKNMIEQQSQLIADLSEKIDQQNEKIDKQQDYINTRIAERDKALMQSLNQSLETQKQIASNQEQEQEQKKGFFSKLFKK